MSQCANPVPGITPTVSLDYDDHGGIMTERGPFCTLEPAINRMAVCIMAFHLIARRLESIITHPHKAPHLRIAGSSISKTFRAHLTQKGTGCVVLVPEYFCSAFILCFI